MYLQFDWWFSRARWPRTSFEGLTCGLWRDDDDFKSYQSHWFKSSSSSRWMIVTVKSSHQKRICVRMHNNNKVCVRMHNNNREYASGWTRTTKSMRQDTQQQSMRQDTQEQQRVCVRMHNNREYASGCTRTTESMRQDAQQQERVCVRMHKKMIQEFIRWCCSLRCCPPRHNVFGGRRIWKIVSWT